MHFCLTGQYTPQALKNIMENPTSGKRGADVRPDFNWKGAPKAKMGFRQDGAK
jgi:hypothetical protein